MSTYSILDNNSNVDDNDIDTTDNVFVLSLNYIDRIAISPRNALLESLTNAAIVDEWPRGVQSSGVKLDGKAFVFKLKGSPLLSWTSTPDIQFCKTMLKVLHNFHQAGFVVQCPLDVSLNRLEAHAVVLRRIERQFDLTTTMFGILPHSTDRLQLINAPANVVAVVKQTISTHWRRGIQSAEQADDGTFKIKIGGRIWMSELDEAIEVRLVMAQLHNALLRLGFERYASVHVERASGIPAMMVFQKVEATLVKGK